MLNVGWTLWRGIRSRLKGEISGWPYTYANTEKGVLEYICAFKSDSQDFGVKPHRGRHHHVAAVAELVQNSLSRQPTGAAFGERYRSYQGGRLGVLTVGSLPHHAPL